jgi:tetratricopeptide (TPR) repeat protein
LANIDRRNPQLQLNISECLDKLGDLKLGAADGRGALAAYEESLTIRRHLSRDAPSNPSRQLNVAGSLEKVGDLKLADGDAQGALAAYQEMLCIDRALVTIDGSNSEWQRNLSLSLERLGDVTLAVGDTVAAVAAYEQTVALRRRLAASDKSNIQWQREVSASLEKISRLERWAENNVELQRDLSATSERLENTSLCAGTVLRKLSSIPKLIAATRRQRYIRIGLASVGKLSTQVRACVQGFQRSTVILRKLPSLIAAIRLQSQTHLGISSAIARKVSAQVRACVRGLQRSVEVNGSKLKWLFPSPSRSRGGRVPIPNQNEAQHDGSTHGQSDVSAPIGKENTANNSLTASPSSTVDEPNDATSVEASMITGGRASKMDIQPQVSKSPVKARSGKRRRRKRKPSPRLPANQKSDMVRVRMN